MNKITWRPQTEIDIEKIAIARKSKILELKASCTEAIYKGFTSTSTGHSFGFNELDQQNFTQQAVMIIASGGNYTDQIQWKTRGGTVETLNAEQFTQLMLEAKDHKENEQKKYWALEIQVNAASTIEEIQSITWE